jgi:hypothetical protein
VCPVGGDLAHPVRAEVVVRYDGPRGDPPPRPREDHVGHRSGLPDLVAVHRDGAGARRTIERLSRSGVDGGSIELLGRIEVVTAGRAGDRQTDLGSSLALGKQVLRGALWGLLPGAAFGILLLVLATEPSPVVVVSGAAGGASFGASVGALTGLLATPTMASSWERTFAPLVPGGVVVGIRVTSTRVARRARRALRGAEAHSVTEVVDLDDLGDEPDRGGAGPPP